MGSTCELLNADVLCSIAETEEELLERWKCWKDPRKSKELRVNMDKTDVTFFKVRNVQAGTD